MHWSNALHNMPDYHCQPPDTRPATLYFNLQPREWEFLMRKRCRGWGVKAGAYNRINKCEKEPKRSTDDAREYGQHPGYQYNHSFKVML